MTVREKERGPLVTLPSENLVSLISKGIGRKEAESQWRGWQVS